MTMAENPQADGDTAGAGGDAADQSAVEVEQKYRLGDVAALEHRLSQLGATEARREHHRDTYYRHPSRDFRQTRETLRIRRVLTEQPDANRDQEATTRVTYKGPYSLEGVKSRPELEWRIDPCDPDGRNLAKLLQYLGLQEVLTVHKTRRSFHLEHQQHRVTVTIDDTRELGWFAEVETIATGDQDVAACGALVETLAGQLGLREVEKRSYLRMALEAAGGSSDSE